jgi:hypothetical protein
MERSDFARVGCDTRLDFIGWDGFVGKAKNLSHAIRCFSIWNQLGSCVMMGVQAASFLDLERTGQTTFAARTNELAEAEGDGLSGTTLRNYRETFRRCETIAQVRIAKLKPAVPALGCSTRA